MVDRLVSTEDAFELKSLADKIRRQPQLARDLNVSLLVADVHGRWREHSDMLQASEEVPVAAWIVRKKVEGLIRPDEPESEPVGFDPDLRPQWLQIAVDAIQDAERQGNAFWTGTAVPLTRPRAPVKDPSPWKLAWSYPVLRPKKSPPPRVVAREAEPLALHMHRLLALLESRPHLGFCDHVTGQSRAEWVAQFLAAVHLWHDRSIEANQIEPFGEILLRLHPIGGEGK